MKESEYDSFLNLDNLDMSESIDIENLNSQNYLHNILQYSEGLTNCDDISFKEDELNLHSDLYLM